jgi:hypothetical protein
VYANSIFGAGAQFTSLATLAEQHMAAQPEAADRVKVQFPTLHSTEEASHATAGAHCTNSHKILRQGQRLVMVAVSGTAWACGVLPDA